MSETVKTEVITKKFIPVVGFALVCRQNASPWFQMGEFRDAIPRQSRHLAAPTRGSFTNNLPRLQEAGILDVKKDDDNKLPGVPRWSATITDLGEVALIDRLIRCTTREGLTLPQLLHIDYVVDHVVENTSYLELLKQTVYGSYVPEH